MFEELPDKNGKLKHQSAITATEIDSGTFTTNGSQIILGVPIPSSSTENPKHKIFNCKTGKLEKSITDLSFSHICYDFSNNVVWGLKNSNKTIDKLICFSNKNIPDKFTYAEDSEFHNPFGNERILEIALDGLGYSDEENINSSKYEKLKEDWQILLNLGFSYKDNKKLSQRKVVIEHNEKSSTSSQLMILANIARLADSYANLEELCSSVDQQSSIENFKKPYSVTLLPKVFNCLEEFLDVYNESVFSDDINDDLLKQCCFLCTLRILKFNLACLELFQKQLSKLEVHLPDETFNQKLKKLVMKILESSFNEYDDIRKSIYEEALSILQYNLSIIFPTMDEIFTWLTFNIKNFNNDLNKDISNSILGYLKNKNHVRILVAEILDEKNLMNKSLKSNLLEVVNFIISFEVNIFISFQHKIESDLLIEEYKEPSFIENAISFLIEFQREILYESGKKNIDKMMEYSSIYNLLSELTESITYFAKKIFITFEKKTSEIGYLIEKRFLSGKQEEVEEEKESLKIKKKAKKTETPEQKILNANEEFWTKLTDIFSYKVGFSKVLSLHINTLSILSSNFLVAAKNLKTLNEFLNSLNNLYRVRQSIFSKKKSQSHLKESTKTYESIHPYQNNMSKKEKIQFIGAKKLRIIFDKQCNILKNAGYLQFFSDELYEKRITERMHKNNTESTFPTQDLIINGDTFYYHFYTDNSKRVLYGYKFTIYATIVESSQRDLISELHRTTCWLASKCAAQLVSGSGMIQAFLQDEDQRYNSLLNSKLFSGGIEKHYFSLDQEKESIWLQLADIINEYDAGHLSEYITSGEMSAKEKEEEIVLKTLLENPESNPKISRILNYLQKIFSRECLWANLGGSKADRLVRSAFVVFLRHAGLTQDFIDAMHNFEEFVKNDFLVKKLSKKWHASSRMRPWLVEKRKDIDDLADKNKQQLQQQQQQREKQKAAAAALIAANELKKKENKASKKSKKKNEKEEEKVMEFKIEEDEDGINQKMLIIRDTEEIVQKMIDSIAKKAEFLIQLIPSQHWVQNLTEKKDKQLLFRTSSQVEEFENKEQEWKRRLLQWKSVRQSKEVYKSLEEESLAIHQSLTTSVLSKKNNIITIQKKKKKFFFLFL